MTCVCTTAPCRNGPQRVDLSRNNSRRARSALLGKKVWCDRAFASGPSGSASAAGAGQSQPTEGHADQPQHQGRGTTDYSVAGAGTPFGDGQIQPAVGQGDQPRHQGHDTPVTGGDPTVGSAQSQSTDDHADQRQPSGRGGPKSPERQAVKRGGGWLGNVRGH